MSGINKVILIGNLGKDPDIRMTKEGKEIANFSVATSEEWKDQAGQKQSKTEWHNVVVFGGLAKVVANWVKKGTKVYIEGKLQTRKWQDQAGNDRYSTEVVVNGFGGTLQMLNKIDGGSGDNVQNQSNAQSNYNSPPATENSSVEDIDDDIPF